MIEKNVSQKWFTKMILIIHKNETLKWYTKMIYKNDKLSTKMIHKNEINIIDLQKWDSYKWFTKLIYKNDPKKWEKKETHKSWKMRLTKLIHKNKTHKNDSQN